MARTHSVEILLMLMIRTPLRTQTWLDLLLMLVRVRSNGLLCNAYFACCLSGPVGLLTLVHSLHDPGLFLHLASASAPSVCPQPGPCATNKRLGHLPSTHIGSHPPMNHGRVLPKRNVLFLLQTKVARRGRAEGYPPKRLPEVGRGEVGGVHPPVIPVALQGFQPRAPVTSQALCGACQLRTPPAQTSSRPSRPCQRTVGQCASERSEPVGGLGGADRGFDWRGPILNWTLMHGGCVLFCCQDVPSRSNRCATDSGVSTLCGNVRPARTGPPEGPTFPSEDRDRLALCVKFAGQTRECETALRES